MHRSVPAASAPAGEQQQPSTDEVKRLQRRRRLARKTPEQRRKMRQYQRRHNEKDGRLFYCDYCDLFVSSRQKTWAAHLCTARHMDAFRSYYELAAHVESGWLSEIHDKVELARSREVHRVQQQRAGAGASTPLPALQVAPGIVVGGTGSGMARLGSGHAPGKPLKVSALPQPPPPPAYGSGSGAAVAPTITVGGKAVAPPPLPSSRPPPQPPA